MIKKKMESDYKGRKVIKQEKDIAIIKDNDNSVLVVSGLYEYPKSFLNYLVVEWFARSEDEAREIADNLLKDPFLLVRGLNDEKES